MRRYISHYFARLALVAGLFVAAITATSANPPIPPGAIHSFTTPSSSGVNADGGSVQSRLTAMPDGYLYGTSTIGGANGVGTIFKCRADGSHFTVLYSFSAVSGGNPYTTAPGTFPNSNVGTPGVTNNDGYSAYNLTPGTDLGPSQQDPYFYGTTQFGGQYGDGTIFAIGKDGTNFHVLHHFGSPKDGNGNTISDGLHATCGLVEGPDQLLYGVTQNGGAAGSGVVWQIHRDGTGYTILHTFNGTTDGAHPHGALTYNGTKGDFYGTTLFQGSLGNATTGGTIYTITSAGTFTVISNFTQASGSVPAAELTDGGDGNYYGTCSQGGTLGGGTVFRIAYDGTGFRALYNFDTLRSDGTNFTGAVPLGALTYYPIDGNLYGTTSAGSLNGNGSIFRIKIFTDPAVPVGPFQAVTVDTTINPGQNPNGVKVNRGGFAAEAALTYSPVDQYLHGTTFNGGTGGVGTLYRLAPVHSNLLWVNADGRANLWTIDTVQESATGNNPRFTSSHDFGPYPGWQATGLTTGPDGADRVLWTHSDGMIALWYIDTQAFTTGTPDKQKVYGPYPNWAATSITVGSDGTEHILWDYTAPLPPSSTGPISLWSISQTSSTFSYQDYGPFDTWTAVSLSSSLNTTHLLWHTPAGAASLWTIDPLGNIVLTPTFGPFKGATGKNTWIPIQVAAGLGGERELLWVDSSSGAASFWSVDEQGNYTIFPNPKTPPAYGSVTYGPYSGWSCVSIACGPNGVPRLLWSNPGQGLAAFWSMNPDGSFTQQVYGPYPGWQCVAASIGP